MSKFEFYVDFDGTRTLAIEAESFDEAERKINAMTTNDLLDATGVQVFGGMELEVGNISAADPPTDLSWNEGVDVMRKIGMVVLSADSAEDIAKWPSLNSLFGVADEVPTLDNEEEDLPEGRERIDKYSAMSEDELAEVKGAFFYETSTGGAGGEFVKLSSAALIARKIAKQYQCPTWVYEIDDDQTEHLALEFDESGKYPGAEEEQA